MGKRNKINYSPFQNIGKSVKMVEVKDDDSETGEFNNFEKDGVVTFVRKGYEEVDIPASVKIEDHFSRHKDKYFLKGGEK